MGLKSMKTHKLFILALLVGALVGLTTLSHAQVSDRALATTAPIVLDVNDILTTPEALSSFQGASWREAEPILSDLLQEHDPDTRTRVAAILASYGHKAQQVFIDHLESEQPTAVAELLPFLRPSSSPQLKRLVSLFSRNFDGQEEALRRTVMSWGETSRTTVLNAYFKGTLSAESTADAIREETTAIAPFATEHLHEEADELEKAIRLAGLIGDPQLLDYLAPLYQSGSTRQRVRIVRAWAGFPASLVERQILNALDNPSSQIKTAAIEAVGDCHIEQAIPQLFKILSKSSANSHIVVRALGKLRASEAIPVFSELFVYGIHILKTEILTACHQINNQGALRVLMEGATDYDPAIRAKAMRLLSTAKLSL